MVRFYDCGYLIEVLHVADNDVRWDLINWLLSHDIGPIHHISVMYRIYSRAQYGAALSSGLQKMKRIEVNFLVDVGRWKPNNNTLVRIYDLENKSCIVDVPEKLKLAIGGVRWL